MVAETAIANFLKLTLIGETLKLDLLEMKSLLWETGGNTIEATEDFLDTDAHHCKLCHSLRTNGRPAAF